MSGRDLPEPVQKRLQGTLSLDQDCYNAIHESLTTGEITKSDAVKAGEVLGIDYFGWND